jgi:hypothetical protein
MSVVNILRNYLEKFETADEGELDWENPVIET